MADYSFALSPSYDGFKKYCDIVKEILLLHNGIMNNIYDTTDDGGNPLGNVNSMIGIISNFVSIDTTIPIGYSVYNIDNNGLTQSKLLPVFYNLKNEYINESYAKTITRRIVLETVATLQSHLVELITDSTSYNNINDYYMTNQSYNNSNSNVLNGGYHFTSDWNRLSTYVGVPYNIVCDID